MNLNIDNIKKNNQLQILLMINKITIFNNNELQYFKRTYHYYFSRMDFFKLDLMRYTIHYSEINLIRINYNLNRLIKTLKRYLDKYNDIYYEHSHFIKCLHLLDLFTDIKKRFDNLEFINIDL